MAHGSTDAAEVDADGVGTQAASSKQFLTHRRRGRTAVHLRDRSEPLGSPTDLAGLDLAAHAAPAQ
jgi:hypothetical protein